MTSGHTAGQGLPHRRLRETTERWRWGQWWGSMKVVAEIIIRAQTSYLMSSSCRSSWLAWKMGFLVKSSPRMHLSHDTQQVRKYIPLFTKPLKWECQTWLWLWPNMKFIFSPFLKYILHVKDSCCEPAEHKGKENIEYRTPDWVEFATWCPWCCKHPVCS